MASKSIPHRMLDLRESLMDLWDAWGIQALIVASILFQIILTLLGNRRKQLTGLIGIVMRSIVWTTYLLATEVVPFSLGKLTGLRIDNTTLLNITAHSTDTKENYSSPVETLREKELKALLAPLLLLQLGYTDNITAYSMEDNQLGLRQFLNMTFTVTVVLGIIVRCWNQTSFAILYIPMSLAGIIKYAEGIWALKFSPAWNTSVASEDKAQDTMSPEYLKHFEDLELLINAYDRFNLLKPHLESWIYHRPFVRSNLHLIDEYSPQEAFKITEIELGFMYDVLYTKAPLIYTKLGFLVRLLSFSFLVTTVCMFKTIAMPIPSSELLEITDYNFPFRSRLSSYTTFTFYVLLLVLILELYQILLLPYSAWMIVRMSKRSKWPFVFQFLKFLTRRAVNNCRQWSNSLHQFNMFKYYLHEGKDWTRHIKFLKFRGIYTSIERNWSLTRLGPAPLPEHLKVTMIEAMTFIDYDRCYESFRERGQLTMDIYDANELEWSIKMAFDRSIITWHLATNICYHCGNRQSMDVTNDQSTEHDRTDDHRLQSKLLSDYMVYLLLFHPSMLSTSTGNIVFEHAYSKVKDILKESNKLAMTEENLAHTIYDAQQPDLSESTTDLEHRNASIISNWNTISDAKKLAESLMVRWDKWELISNMWMEMLCYAAATSGASHHIIRLRQGGEFITLVWLLLFHKTIRLNP